MTRLLCGPSLLKSIIGALRQLPNEPRSVTSGEFIELAFVASATGYREVMQITYTNIGRDSCQ